MPSTSLPQLDSGLFLSDGGLETTLIFLEGTLLPQFAAFVLLRGYLAANNCAHITGPTWRCRPPHPMPVLCWKHPPGGPIRTGAACSATTHRRLRKPALTPCVWASELRDE